MEGKLQLASKPASLLWAGVWIRRSYWEEIWLTWICHQAPREITRATNGYVHAAFFPLFSFKLEVPFLSPLHWSRSVGKPWGKMENLAETCCLEILHGKTMKHKLPIIEWNFFLAASTFSTFSRQSLPVWIVRAISINRLRNSRLKFQKFKFKIRGCFHYGSMIITIFNSYNIFCMM